MTLEALCRDVLIYDTFNVADASAASTGMGELFRQCTTGGGGTSAGGVPSEQRAAGADEAAAAAEEHQKRRQPTDNPHRRRAQPPPPGERVPRCAPFAHAGLLRPPGT
jgi:hypothetical protein